MTVTRGIALLLTVAAAGGLVKASAPDATTSGVRLKAISSRLHSRGASLVIEASEPVAYTATQPDPLTVLLEFRNVASDEVANSVVANAASPIARVSIEAAQSMGKPAARVRIALVRPVAHHVRSDRNTVVIDFDKPSATAAVGVLTADSRASAPDAMLALRAAVAEDPIAALGLDRPANGPSGAAASLAPPPGASPAVLPAYVAAAYVASPPVAPPPVAPPPVAPAPAPVAAYIAPPLVAPAPIAPAPASIARPIVLRNAAPALQGAPVLQAPSMIVPADPTTNQIGVRSAGRQFTGHPISLDFQGADLRAVLRTFAEISGLNIVIDPAVQGTVDVALRDVPWDQALDIILRANKLGYFVDGTIVRIAPLTVLADEESQRRKLGEEQALAGQLEVLTKTLSYAKAEELQALLTKSALSQRGTVQVDGRTNTLIISDLRDRLTLASDLIATLDRPQPQVEIEARIVQTNKAYARALGVQWGFNGRVDPALGNTTGLAFPNNGSLGGRLGPTGPAGVPTAVNLGASGPNSAIGLALGSINGAFNLDVALTALEQSGNGRLLSTPRVTTQSNIAAEMTQGVEIPIQTVANNTVTVSFKSAALTLKVTPQITAANTVIMQIAVENASPDFSRQVNNIPPINTQRAITQVLVSDGQTTVIGGIYTSSSTTTSDKTPGLGSIPLLRWLFKRETINDSNTELLIFITPRIIKG
jgi:type IV pilus assembly protein PilQ